MRYHKPACREQSVAVIRFDGPEQRRFRLVGGEGTDCDRVRGVETMILEEQLVMWDEDGPVRHVVALALHEIGHAGTRQISVPACNDTRLRRVTEDPANPHGLDAGQQSRAW